MLYIYCEISLTGGQVVAFRPQCLGRDNPTFPLCDTLTSTATHLSGPQAMVSLTAPYLALPCTQFMQIQLEFNLNLTR